MGVVYGLGTVSSALEGAHPQSSHTAFVTDGALGCGLRRRHVRRSNAAGGVGGGGHVRFGAWARGSIAFSAELALDLGWGGRKTGSWDSDSIESWQARVCTGSVHIKTQVQSKEAKKQECVVRSFVRSLLVSSIVSRIGSWCFFVQSIGQFVYSCISSKGRHFHSADSVSQLSPLPQPYNVHTLAGRTVPNHSHHTPHTQIFITPHHQNGHVPRHQAPRGCRPAAPPAARRPRPSAPPPRTAVDARTTWSKQQHG